jgi:hypothetical protein
MVIDDAYYWDSQGPVSDKVPYSRLHYSIDNFAFDIGDVTIFGNGGQFYWEGYSDQTLENGRTELNGYTRFGSLRPDFFYSDGSPYSYNDLQQWLTLAPIITFGAGGDIWKQDDSSPNIENLNIYLTQVPKPSPILLLGAGLVRLLRFRKKLKK